MAAIYNGKTRGQRDFASFILEDMNDISDVQPDEAQSHTEELDPCVWNIPHSDKVPPYVKHFMNITKYNSANYYFAQTRFHEYFYEFLETNLNKLNEIGENCIVGDQGIGKSSTAIYYVLTCKEKGIKNIHYIDMNLVKGEMQINRLKEYAKEIEFLDVLILDHVTLFNRGIVADVESLVPTKRIIYIKTGFSASAKRNKVGYLLGKEWELNREEFLKIWIESMKRSKFMNNLETQKDFITELYDSCKDRFILTPRLLHKIHIFFVIDGDQYSKNDEEGKHVGYFIMRYKSGLIKDIREFELRLVNILDCGTYEEKQQCGEFSVNTKILLQQIKLTGSILLTLEMYFMFMIPVNIFKCEFGRVKKNNMEKDSRFLEMGFKEEDEYVILRLRVPELLDHWQKVFPFDVIGIFENKYGINIKHLLYICFQSEGIRKEVENELIRLQYQLRTLIVPGDLTVISNVETQCKVSNASNNCMLIQSNSVNVSTLEDIAFIRPTLSHLEKISAKLKFQGHDRNVEKLAYYLREEIQKNKERSLIVHPAIDNMKGIDYIVYTCMDGGPASGAKKAKRPKNHDIPILHLVQVATGATHSGISVGEALKVFQSVMNGFLHLHVTFMIVSKECNKYKLNGNISFENASVINLTHLAMDGIIQESKLLSSIVDMVRMYPLANKVAKGI